MDYIKISKALSNYDKDQVTVFVNHCKATETEKNNAGSLKNWWFPQVKAEQLIDLFKKVHMGGVFIDGETVILAFKSKKLTVNYDYQAYKNRLLYKYPETIFDMQVVFEGDMFSFQKKNGKVLYEHNLKNPFVVDKNIVGTYCIIKNKRGEFIEVLTMEDIEKMKGVARTKDVWEKWFDRMVLKSGIKRACKTHFNDVTGDMDKIDNEDVDFDNITPPASVFDLIKTYETEKELLEWASSQENAVYHNDDEFRKAVKRRKIELIQDADPAVKQQ